MTAPALAIVRTKATRKPEQLLLRPVLFNRLMVREAPDARTARRRPPRPRTPPGTKAVAAALTSVAAPYPFTSYAWEEVDLLTYRAPARRGPVRSPRARPKRAAPRQAPSRPIRPAALQVWSPRKLRSGARPRSLGLKPLTSEERRRLYQDERVLRRWGVLQARPRVLGDCDDEPGPCPRVSCRANLYLEVDEDTGAVKLNFPDKEVWELAETCAFKVVARRGALSLEEVGKLLNLTQERVSQIEEGGTDRLKRWARGKRRS